MPTPSPQVLAAIAYRVAVRNMAWAQAAFDRRFVEHLAAGKSAMGQAFKAKRAALEHLSNMSAEKSIAARKLLEAIEAGPLS